MPTERNLRSTGGEEGREISFSREEVSALKRELVSIAQQFSEFSSQLIQMNIDVSPQFIETLRRITRTFWELAGELERGTISYRTLRERIERIERGFEGLREEVDKLTDDLKEKFEKLGEKADSITESFEVGSREGRGIWESLKRGIPLEDLGAFGRAVSEVGQFLRTWARVAFPLTVIDIVRTWLKTVDEISLRAMDLQQQLSMGFIQVQHLARPTLEAINQELKAFGIGLGMSSRDVMTAFAELQATGLLYSTIQGRAIVEMQRALSEGTVRISDFTSTVEETIRQMRLLGFEFNMTVQQVERFTAQWRRLLMTEDIEEAQKVLVEFQKAIKDSGWSIDDYNRFMTSLIERTRLYGLDVWQLSGVTEKYMDLLRDGILTVDDFINALVRAREGLDPQRQGTLVWTLANFASDPEVKSAFQQFLKSPEGLFEGMALMTTRWEVIRKIVEKEGMEALPSALRETIYRIAEVTGALREVDGRRIVDFDKIMEFANKAQAEFLGAVSNLSNTIAGGTPAISAYFSMMLAGYHRLDEFVSASSISREALQSMSEAGVRYASATRDMEKVIEDAKRAINTYTTVMNEAAQHIRESIRIMVDFLNSPEVQRLRQQPSQATHNVQGKFADENKKTVERVP